MVVFGWREAKIDVQPVNHHSCSYCNTPKYLFMQINRAYLHVFWVPFIPLNKKVYSICGHCKQVLNKNQMPPDLQQKALEQMHQAKTPWWMFFGIGVALFLLISALSF